ncbi:hypothetical protein RF55_24373, partial [Lasius niger]
MINLANVRRSVISDLLFPAVGVSPEVFPPGDTSTAKVFIHCGITVAFRFAVQDGSDVMRIPGGLIVRPHAKIVRFEGGKMTLLRGGIHHGHPPLRAGRQPFIDRLRIVPQREQRFGGIDRGCRRGVLRGLADRRSVAGRQQQKSHQAQRF